jgi:hypothetical protein
MKAAALRLTLCVVMLTFVLIAAFARAEAEQVNQPTTLSNNSEILEIAPKYRSLNSFLIVRIFTITFDVRRFLPEVRRYSNGPTIATSRAATLVAA